MKRPAEVYRPSRRPFPETLKGPDYPAHFEVRRVSRNGAVRWKGDWLNVGHSLIEENLGFLEVEDGIWNTHFGATLIGRFDERDLQLVGSLSIHYRSGQHDPTHLS
jgi:hypothetical protein